MKPPRPRSCPRPIGAFLTLLTLGSLGGGCAVAPTAPDEAPAAMADREPAKEATFPDIDARLERELGIPARFSGRPSLSAAHGAVLTEIARRERDRDRNKSQLKFLEVARDQGAAALAVGDGSEDWAAYLMAKRILYGVMAYDEEEAAEAALAAGGETAAASRLADWRARLAKLAPVATRARRYVLQDFLFSVPYVADPSRATLGARDASAEARDLSDAGGARFLDPARLAGRTHAQVAALDIRESHPVWRTEAARARAPAPWAALERHVETGIDRALRKDRALAAGETYRLDVARRVLIFDGIKTSATSPKIKAKDVYGQSWSLKWGDEVQTEPVSARLWMRLGGKLADLVYGNGRGAGEVVLVFGKPGASAQGCAGPRDGAELGACLLDSRYQFNLRPYLDEQGTLTRENVDRVLGRLPEARRAPLLGRNFATFRESSQEIKPDKSVVRRGGAVAFSGLGALEDRVARGLIAFNFWIGNTDAKDDNSVQALAPGWAAGAGGYVEYQHDLGATLGGFIGGYGAVASLTTGEDFADLSPGALGILPRRLAGNQVFFKDPVLYYPRAWLKTTFADVRWMVLKIVALERPDLEEVARATRWPEFMQRVLVTRLIERRNRLARLFVPEASALPLPDLTYRVDLSTPAARSRAVGAAGLGAREAAEFEALVAEHRPDLRAPETIVSADGKVSVCERSFFVNFLQRSRYPSGLGRRVSRLLDGGTAEHRGCVHGAKEPPSDVELILRDRVGRRR